MLRDAKLMLLRMARGAGVAKLVMNSSWRRNRLLILSYHGTSIDDEHEWNSKLYLAPAALRSRMEMIRTAGCNVLPLDDALKQLYRGVLPARSVVITFDDGNYDFYSQAFPVVKSFGFPVTVYLTTYYAAYQRPVYDVMIRYLAWKSRGGTLRWPEVLGSDVAVDVSYEPDRQHVLKRLGAYPAEHRLSGAEKDALLCRFAELLGVDYDSILRRRLLHIMSLDEARELAAAGSTSSCIRIGTASPATRPFSSGKWRTIGPGCGRCRLPKPTISVTRGASTARIFCPGYAKWAWLQPPPANPDWRRA